MKTILESLIAQKELLSDPKRWTKGHYARDKFNDSVDPNSRDAVCWCQSGAMYKVNGTTRPDDMSEEAYIKNGVTSVYNKFLSSIEFNDSDSTTHDGLMKFYDDCIKQARKIVIYFS